MHYKLANEVLKLAKALAVGWRALAEREDDAAREIIALRRFRHIENPRAAREFAALANQAFVKAGRAAAVAEAIKTGTPLPTWKLHVGNCFVFRSEESVPMPHAVKLPKQFGRLPVTRIDRPEVTCGTHLVFARRKSDRFSLSLGRVEPTGDIELIHPIGRALEGTVKAAILNGEVDADLDILLGEGKAASIIRRIHADRGGYVGTMQECESRALLILEMKRLAKDRAAKEAKNAADDAEALSAV